MRKRCFSCVCGVLAWLLFCSMSFAARLYLDSRPIDPDAQTRAAMNYRELPRQTLLVIAAEELGVEVIDASLEPDAKPLPGDVRIGLERDLSGEPLRLRIDLFDAAGKSIDRTDIPTQPRAPRFINLNDLTAKLDAAPQRDKWKALLAKQLAVTPKPAKWDATLPAPAGVERALGSIDFASAFLAAQETHKAIAETGGSPARLAVLVRAYANLGESTRELYSAQSSAMFARGYVYAQRLLRLAPQDPASWYARAYLLALHGMIAEPLADLKHADELAKGAAAPSWVEMTRAMLAFDTPTLFAKMPGDDAPMASYFAWRTVEHAPLNGLIINFAKMALKYNPAALRALNSIGGNSSIGYSGQVSSAAPQALYALIARTGSQESIPDSIRGIIRPAVEGRFAEPAYTAMIAAFRSAPREPGQLMPWPAYGSIVHEYQFLNIVRRLRYSAYQIGPDASALAKQVYPFIRDHRYAVAVATFDRTGQLAGPNPTEKLRAMPLADDSISTMWMGLNEHYMRLGINNDPKKNLNWLARTTAQSDKTPYDAAEVLWFYRLIANNAGATPLRQTAARELEQMAPNHPVALAWRIMEDWPAVQERAPQIEKDFGNNPMISYALGTAYVSLKQYDRAVPLLEKAVLYAPDRPVFQQLAEVQLARGDEEGWLRTWDRYFKESDDTGLDHASANRDIAVRLMNNGKFEKAVPYAKAAAGSGSQWGLAIYGDVLTRLGQYPEARQINEGIASRYSPIWYHRWAVETGKGDAAAAARAVLPRIPQLDMTADPVALMDVGTYYYLESNKDKAVEYWKKSYAKRKESYSAMMLALSAMEKSNTAEARQLLLEAMGMEQTTPRLRLYNVAVIEMKLCLEEPARLPAMAEQLTVMPTDPELVAPRGNCCYFLGRVCELRAKTDQAKQWYRMALDTYPASFIGRAMAADALRKLGEEFYK